MWNMITLQTIGIMVVCAGLGIVLTRKFHLPHIVLYIITGLALGQLEIAFLDKEILKESQSAVQIISEAGIALLLFLVGLELSLAKIKDVGRNALVAGLAQVFLTALLGFGIAHLLGFNQMEAFVLAIAMTFSSTIIVVKLLSEKSHLSALYGRISIGILLVQDLVVVLVLTVVAGLKGGNQSLFEVGLELGKALVGVISLFGLTLFAAKIFLRRLMDWASASTETLLIWSLTWCFLIVALAHAINLSPEIGAFLAGVSLAQLPLSNSLKQRVHPLMNFFIGIFFIALGMEIDFVTAWENWPAALGFILFVLGGKILLFFFILSRSGFNERTSFVSAISLAQISEFSFLFIALAFEVGLVGKAPVAIVALTGLVTFIFSSFVIVNNERIYFAFKNRGLLKVFGASQEKISGEYTSNKRKGHVIVIGMNSLGREICSSLEKGGYKVLAIDNDPKKLKDLPCETLVGNADYSSILDEASFQSAKLVVTTLRIEDVNNSIVFRCKPMGVPVAAHGFDSSVIPDLKRLGTDFIIDSKSSWLRRLFHHLEERGALAP